MKKYGGVAKRYRRDGVAGRDGGHCKVVLMMKVVHIASLAHFKHTIDGTKAPQETI